MPPPGNPAGRAASKAEREVRRDEAIKLSVSGKTYEQIAVILGYNSKQAVHVDIKAALRERARRLDITVDMWRAKHEALLSEALVVAHRIMNAEHLAHSNGRPIRREVEREDGSVTLVDVIDDGPNLAAAAQLVRISESLRKLVGADAPAKVEQQVDSTISYVVQASPEELDQL